MASLDRIEDRTGRVAIYSPSVTSNPYHAQMVRKPDGDFRTVTYVDGIAPLISLITGVKPGWTAGQSQGIRVMPGFLYALRLWAGISLWIMRWSCAIAITKQPGAYPDSWHKQVKKSTIFSKSASVMTTAILYSS